MPSSRSKSPALPALDPPELQATLEELLELFGITLTYPPLSHLLNVLERLAPAAARSGLSNQQFWIDLGERLPALRLALRGLGVAPSGPTRRQGNPAGGNFSLSQIASVPLQSETGTLGDGYDGLCALLICNLAEGRLSRSKCDALSIKLRGFAGSDKHREFFRQLPGLSGDAPYLDRLRHALGATEEAPSAWGKDAESLLKEIRSLAGLIPPKAAYRSTQSPRPPQPAGSHRAVTRSGEVGEKPPVLSGRVAFAQQDAVPDESGEAPSLTPIYESGPEANELALSGAAFRELARQATYWLDRSSEISSFNRSLLNPVERKHLSRYLSSALQRQSVAESGPAALLALSYATGFDVAALARARIGTDGVFTFGGTYRRRLWSPPDGYVPPGQARPYLEQIVSEVELPLPATLREWFLRHGRHLARHSHIASALGSSEDVVLSNVKQVVSELRDNGRYRIKLSRIRAALAAELTVAFRNPVLTTLLAGSPEQQAPPLMYYMSIHTTDLITSYQQITDRMFCLAP